jgi:UDP-glucose:tetrahydrobiopterin glucosyltransferase
MQLLFISTPIGFLGSGAGGGVELTLINIAQALQQRGHVITIIAPKGSWVEGCTVLQVEGTAPPSAQYLERHSPGLFPMGGIVARMWELARQRQGGYDLLVNFAYDWLPFYLTPFFQRPIAHLVSMGSLRDVMDDVIAQVLEQFPGTIGVHSQAQAATFPFGDRCRCLGNGLDLSRYPFNPNPQPWLGWMGRITPEKGLEDAVAAADQTPIPLKIWGAMENPDYWQQICQANPQAPIEYQGFLQGPTLYQALGQCRGLLVTPHWIEAFGNVAIEALACGVPVIAYRRGGPGEIVRHGETGWLVEPDSVAGLVAAIGQLEQIDRQTCRRQADQEYSLEALGQRFEDWLHTLL